MAKGKRSWQPLELDARIPVVLLGDDAGLCGNLSGTCV